MLQLYLPPAPPGKLGDKCLLDTRFRGLMIIRRLWLRRFRLGQGAPAALTEARGRIRHTNPNTGVLLINFLI